MANQTGYQISLLEEYIISPLLGLLGLVIVGFFSVITYPFQDHHVDRRFF